MSFHAEPSVTISARVAWALLKKAGGEEFLQRYRGIRPDIDRDLESVRIAAASHVRSVVKDTHDVLDRGETRDSTRASVTSQEAADLLGITPQGVRKAITSGHLEAERVGRQWAVDVASLDDYRKRRDHDI